MPDTREESGSLFSMLRDAIPKDMSVFIGKVISEKPLKIQALNDEKLILHEGIICLPRHLTDYETKCDIRLADGRLDSITVTEGAHSQPDAGFGGAHLHHLETYNIYKAYLKVYNALKLGEIVYVLGFNEGKKYYILDREG
ncbi:MAG: DUF2577 domain-containing protein [Oscillospiraceae bacterium]|jgi:hypothetical protein|nr:DUF2577 domain-containing protein [Oscillospiraceae bacterium]